MYYQSSDEMTISECCDMMIQIYVDIFSDLSNLFDICFAAWPGYRWCQVILSVISWIVLMLMWVVGLNIQTVWVRYSFE